MSATSICEAVTDGTSDDWYVGYACDGLCWDQVCSEVPFWNVFPDLLISRSRGILLLPFASLATTFLLLVLASTKIRRLRHFARKRSRIASDCCLRAARGRLGMMLADLLRFPSGLSNLGLVALVFLLVNTGLTIYASYYWHSDNQYAIKSGAYSFTVGSGLVAVECMGLAMLSCAPIHRFMQCVTGMTFVRAQQWSKLLAQVALVAMLMHMIAACIYAEDSKLLDRENSFTGYGRLFGTLSLASFSLSTFLAPFLRGRSYELFVSSHVLIVPTLVVSTLHSTQTLLVGGPVVLVFLAGFTYRWLSPQGQQKCTLVSAHTVGDPAVDGQITVLELKPDGNFDFGPLCYAFICIPSVSSVEWHPVSMSSRPDGDTVMFHIKNMGKFSWSGAVAHKVLEADYLARKVAMPLAKTLGVGIQLEGPFGGLSQCSFDVYDVQHLVLVAGGIGMASISSLLTVLLQTHRNQPFKLGRIEQVTVVWVCREPETILWFDALMAQLAGSGLFSVDLYLTKCGLRSTPAAPTMGCGYSKDPNQCLSGDQKTATIRSKSPYSDPGTVYSGGPLSPLISPQGPPSRFNALRGDLDWRGANSAGSAASQGQFEGYEFLTTEFDCGESQSYAEWVDVAQKVCRYSDDLIWNESFLSEDVEDTCDTFDSRSNSSEDTTPAPTVSTEPHSSESPRGRSSSWLPTHNNGATPTGSWLHNSSPSSSGPPTIRLDMQPFGFQPNETPVWETAANFQISTMVPNWKTLFKTIRANVRRGSDVGVFACGGAVMLEDVQMQALLHDFKMQKQVYFV